MTKWLRFEAGGKTGFGTLDGETVNVHEGDMFAGASATGETFALADVRLLPPVVPGKFMALWNNLETLRAKLDGEVPEHALWFVKTPNCLLGPDGVIERPASYDGKVIFEGELGIVIGKRCKNVSEADALDHVFGYTCVNDITAVDLLRADATFEQWCRCKSFDTFGPIGPVIATGLDPLELTVKVVLNGDERQNYPVTDMIRRPAQIVSELSHDVTLEPGDVIACGTNVGVGSMKLPENPVEVTIEGIGTLKNVFKN